MYFSKNGIALMLLLAASDLFSQSVYVPLNSDYYHLIDRYEIRSGKFNKEIFTSFKPTLRSNIAKQVDSASIDQQLSDIDQFNLQYLKNDNWENYPDSLQIGYSKQPFSKKFFTRYNSLFSYRSKDFDLQINPVINFEQSSYNKRYFMSLNTRGIEVRGSIGKRLGFYSFISDNQTFFPDYVKEKVDSAGAIPNEGFYKDFKKNPADPKSGGYDFFSARGYITFNVIKFINVQFGHDKNFIGNGYRSIFLSDYSSKYLFLKLTTKLWKFNYTNLFTEMTAFNNNYNSYYPRKYMAMHHLSFNFSDKFNMGLFESISFHRGDSTGAPGFELNYLNPVIFYREVESYLGSQDKTEVGVDLKWNFSKHFSLYGQLLINEFVVGNLVKQNGWWGNKYAWQVGLKYIDVLGVKNLDLQLEHNFVRPYVYADKNPYTGFSNYNQPIAHPLGANFYEFLGIVRYQPLKRLSLTGKGFYWVYGKDPAGANFGSNVMKSYATRPENLEYGNIVGQGIRTNTIFASVNLSYQLFHNFFIEMRGTMRREKTSNEMRNTHFITAGIRWNIAQRLQEF